MPGNWVNLVFFSIGLSKCVTGNSRQFTSVQLIFKFKLGARYFRTKNGQMLDYTFKWTRMHSSRMCTACSLLYGGSPWRRPPWMGIPLLPWTETPWQRPFPSRDHSCEQNHRQVWKHYLPQLRLRVVKRFPRPYHIMAIFEKVESRTESKLLFVQQRRCKYRYPLLKSKETGSPWHEKVA